jgi:hypothetical protein
MRYMTINFPKERSHAYINIKVADAYGRTEEQIAEESPHAGEGAEKSLHNLYRLR